MTALQQVPQTIAGLFKGFVKPIDALDSVGHMTCVQIGNQFLAKVCGASNALGHQQNRNFALITALELQFPQLLNCQ